MLVVIKMTGTLLFVLSLICEVAVDGLLFRAYKLYQNTPSELFRSTIILNDVDSKIVCAGFCEQLLSYDDCSAFHYR